MKSHSYEAFGTKWKITIWDDIKDEEFEYIIHDILAKSEQFESLFSRFKEDSLVSKLSKEVGTFEVPDDLVNMLSIYFKLYDSSNEKFTPLIGNTISDLGYDKDYSLKEKDVVRKTPNLKETIEIIDVNHIKIKEKVMIDLGALGKGYFVDKIRDYLIEKNIKNFLVDGSGDVYYEGENEIISGLEDPEDEKKIIGTIKIKDTSLCASSTNRRAWNKRSHYIDPLDNSSPSEIVSTWVIAKDTAVSDAISSMLFFVPPENIKEYEFEYLILNKDYMVKKSDGFNAELYLE